MKRPIGVWIIGILALIGGILRILAGLTALGIGGLALTGSLGQENGVSGGEALGIGVFELVVGIAVLFFALSFLRLRRWAWTAMMLVQWVTLIAVVLQFVFDGFNWSSLVGVIIPVLLIVYLGSRGVRRAFFGPKD